MPADNLIEMETTEAAHWECTSELEGLRRWGAKGSAGPLLCPKRKLKKTDTVALLAYVPTNKDDTAT